MKENEILKSDNSQILEKILLNKEYLKIQARGNELKLIIEVQKLK